MLNVFLEEMSRTDVNVSGNHMYSEVNLLTTNVPLI